MREKKLTILMPTYNAQLYIGQAIESVLIQKTSFDYELIIIDDKSTDKSLSIAQGYQSHNTKKIRIIENDKNLGLLATIIKGYELIDTEYFCVIDPDDYYVTNDKFQKAINFLEKNMDFTIYSTNIRVVDDLKGMDNLYVEAVENEMIFDLSDFSNLRYIFVQTSGAIYRHCTLKGDVLEKMKAYLSSDLDFVFEADVFRNIAHLFQGKAYFINTVESVYRYHHGGLWSSLSVEQQTVLNIKSFLVYTSFFDNCYKWVFTKNLLYFLEKNDFKSMLDILPKYMSFEDVLYLLDLALKNSNEYQKKHNETLNTLNTIRELVESQRVNIIEKDQFIRDSHELITCYQNSFSWRITKPIRLVRRLLRILYK